MPVGEIIVLAVVLVAALMPLAGSIGLWLWGRHVAKNRRGLWWSRLARVPFLALALLVIGVGSGLVPFIRAMGSVAEAEPAMKDQLLAQGIAEAVDCAALFSVPAGLLYVALFVAFAVGSLRPPPPHGAG
jgi:hypothetical protein